MADHVPQSQPGGVAAPTEPCAPGVGENAPTPPQSRSRWRRAWLGLGELLRDRRRLLRVTFSVAVLALALWIFVPRSIGAYHLHAARTELAQDHLRPAFEHAIAALSVWPDDPDLLLLAARAARRVGDLEAAGFFLDRCQGSPRLADTAPLERVMLRAQRGELDEVIDFCRSLLDQDHPDTPLITEALVQGFTVSMRLPEAQYFVDQWLERAPDHPQALYLKGRVQLQAGNLEEATALFSRVIELDPARDDARLLLAGIHLDLGQVHEALPHLERLQRALPGNAAVQIRLARCYDLLGRQEEAQPLLDDVIARFPKQPDALAERGKLALRSRDLETAEACLRRACELDPGNAESHYQLMQCLRNQGKKQEAEKMLEKRTRIEQDNKRLRELATHVVSERPRDPALHVEIGEILLRLGATYQAKHWLERAVQLDPHNTAAHRALADFYRSIGQLGKAERHHALSMSPESASP